MFRSQIRFNAVAAAAANETVEEPDGFAKVGDRQDKVADATSKLLPFHDCFIVLLELLLLCLCEVSLNVLLIQT